jgi:hypothetical protein
MITFNLFSVTSFDTLLAKILEWRKKYNGDQNSTQWQRVRFDTPHLKEPTIYDMNILPKEEFIPYMERHLQFIENNMDNADRTKFTTLEYEKFKRVVEYMRTTHYDSVALKQARKNFYNWFTEHDRRRNTNIIESFPELENFWKLTQEEL